MRKTIAHYCFVFGAAALFFFLANMTLAAAVFLFHGSEAVIEEWISIVATLVFVVMACRRYFGRHVIPSLVIVLALAAVFVGSLALSQRFYDISYDGQTYQQEGVIQLANGWNPVYQNLDPAVIGADQKWINYYPKGIWIVESYFYLITHSLQAAKGLNLILVATVLALVYAAFTDAGWLGPWEALIVSVLVACNPVVIVQSLNFYVDGDLYAVLVSLVAIAVSLYSKKRRAEAVRNVATERDPAAFGTGNPSRMPRRRFPESFFALTAFFSAAVLLINIKFTGIVDLGFLLVVFFVILARQSDSKLFLRWSVVSMAALTVGILFLGASPYLTNTLRYQAPFYPLYGKGSEDLKPYNVPGDFIGKNSVEIFFLSFFARSGNVRGVGTTATYKVPFTYASDELDAFRYPDPEEGGFGPLFGGIAIVALLAWALCLFLERDRIRRTGIFWHAGLAIIFIVILCAINPISSLARYVPQAYLLAVIPVIALFMLARPFAAVCAYLLVGLLLVNGYLIGQSYVSYNVQASSEIRATLGSLAVQSEVEPILIHFNEFKSDRVMFAEAGINYVSVASGTDCQNFLPENTTQLCP